MGEVFAGIAAVVVVAIFAFVSGPKISRALTRRLELEREAREAEERKERERRENTPEKIKERQEQERLAAEAKAARDKRDDRSRALDFRSTSLQKERAKPTSRALLSLYNAVPRHPDEDTTELLADNEEGETYVFFQSKVDRKERKVTFAVSWDVRKTNADRVRIRKHYKMNPDHTTCAKVGDLIVDESAHSFTKTEYLAPSERAYYFVQILLERKHDELAASRSLLELVHEGDPDQLRKSLTEHCAPVIKNSFYVTADLSQGSLLEANADSTSKIAQFKAIEKSFALDIEGIDDDPELSDDAKARAREHATDMKEVQLGRLFSRDG